MTVNRQYIQASAGTGEAVRATVTAARSTGSTTFAVNSISNWPTNFIATTGSLNADNTLAIKLVFKGHTSAGSVIIDTIAPGYTDTGSAIGDIIVLKPSTMWADELAAFEAVAHNDDGTIKDGSISADSMFTAPVSPVTRDTEHFFDFVASGLSWSADSPGTNTKASMTAGVVYINGKRLTVAAISAYTFTVSKDTYVDMLDNGDGTAVPVYTPVTNNTTSPSLAANSVRVAIIVTTSTSIPSSANINQGQIGKLLPIVSSVPYMVTDSIGNLICPRDPRRKLLGYRQISSTLSSVTTGSLQLTGLTVPVIVPTGRDISVKTDGQGIRGSAVGNLYGVEIWDGVVGFGTRVAFGSSTSGGANYTLSAETSAALTPTTSSKTYNASLFTGSGTASYDAGGTSPGYLKVELE